MIIGNSERQGTTIDDGSVERGIPYASSVQPLGMVNASAMTLLTVASDKEDHIPGIEKLLVVSDDWERRQDASIYDGTIGL